MVGSIGENGLYEKYKSTGWWKNKMKECPECGEEMFETIEHLQEYLVCPNCHYRESMEE